uniref:Uncharacterized protein n=1 Tax=viral metagenome TaxID=1070528 RepID=A0A6C0BT35_9ZZZZ
MSFYKNINNDLTIFASVLRKLYINRMITEDKYISVCKQIIKIIKAQNHEEMTKSYENVKRIYNTHSWWSMYYFMKNHIDTKKKNKGIIEKSNIRRLTRLHVMSC